MGIGHLNLSFFEKIGTFFDIIPKIIYFLSAVFLGCMDILQALVRKLAGLDVYYVQKAGEGGLFGDVGQAVFQQDPLTEFIYGILGYGDSAPLYKGLNTVFWSLTVFAIICLAVTTMIAIIKSHYNEDTAGTSPWKYVYTAFKAIMTFAIVPFVVVIGMKFSSWALRTLDAITAGSATAETMQTMYGPEYGQIFEANKIDGSDKEWYSNYDFMGIHSATTTTPFSGMLFKACSYDANRVRWDTGMAERMPDVQSYWSGSGTHYVFGQSDAFKKAQTIEEKCTILADQVDFAFANNLDLNGFISSWQETWMSGAKYWSVTDVINALTTTSTGFSKWNVGHVWLYYNLWSYNFIVAFGGGVTIFGILLSVIIGLMSRLMKGAILFLIYPALLGIAPLDNFKAFKSWGSQFIQQVMMAFGAIIGMNLTLLILPYAQNINFFEFNPVNGLINIIIVLTGLMMMKDVIQMISQFAGGADANAAGGALKGEVGKAFAKGATVTGIVGGGAAAFVGKHAVKGGKRAIDTMKKTQSTRFLAQHSKKYADLAAKNPDELSEKDKRFMERYKKHQEHYKETHGGQDFTPGGHAKELTGGIIKSVLAPFLGAHQSMWGGLVDTVAGRKTGDVDIEVTDDGKVKESAHREGGIVGFFKTWHKGKNNEGGFGRAVGDVVGGPLLGLSETIMGLKKGYTKEVDEDGNTIYKDKDGNRVDRNEALKATNFKAFAAAAFGATAMASAGKLLASGFLKSMGELTSSVGLDKMLGGMANIMKEGLTLKGGVFDKDGSKNLEGDKLVKKQHEDTQTRMQRNEDAAKDRHKELIDVLRETRGTVKSGDVPSGVATALEKINSTLTALGTKIDKLGGDKPGG